jgi:hypothetical protein
LGLCEGSLTGQSRTFGKIPLPSDWENNPRRLSLTDVNSTGCPESAVCTQGAPLGASAGGDWSERSAVVGWPGRVRGHRRDERRSGRVAKRQEPAPSALPSETNPLARLDLQRNISCLIVPAWRGLLSLKRPGHPSGAAGPPARLLPQLYLTDARMQHCLMTPSIESQ